MEKFEIERDEATPRWLEMGISMRMIDLLY